MFVCSVCKSVLEKRNNSYICQNNHCFDIAKEGYVNLLKANEKHSKLPGDNAEMVMARKSFLAIGFYKKLVDKVIDLIDKWHSDKGEMTIFDCGCGEGYYDRIIKDSFPKSQFYGLDISKDAVKAASKANKDIQYCVASAFNLPLSTKSFDIVLSFFAPIDCAEIDRILKDDGIFIHINGGEKHLIELKKCLYDDVIIKSEEKFLTNFTLVENIKLSYDIEIMNNCDILNLFKMTPYYFKTTQNDSDKLLNLKYLPEIVDFTINLYKK